LNDMHSGLNRFLYLFRALGMKEVFMPPEWLEQVRSRMETAKGVKNESSLSDLEQAWAGCTRCRLAETRKRLVFGEGDSGAELVFIGEGPGRDEDLLGRPFVGRAGELLTRIIGAMGLRRDQVYITNVVKCRPPGNRNPLPDEMEACNPCLTKQLELIHPKVVCALGAVASRALLETQAPITVLRGRFHSTGAYPVFPTYHPAFLLRNSSKKREVWEDMQQIMEFLGIKKS